MATTDFIQQAYEANMAVERLQELGYAYMHATGTWMPKPAAPAPEPPALEPEAAYAAQEHMPDPDATERALYYLLETLMANSSGEAHGKIKTAMEILKGER